MDGQQAAALVRKSRHFLQNIIKDFNPADADFRPTPDMMSAAQQIRHIAHSTDWFYNGGFRDNWAMDFEAFMAADKAPCTLAEAVKALDEATERAVKTVEKLSAAEIAAPMADNPILGPLPRHVTLASDADHIAHHRGALTVYLRLLGRVPTMVYAD